MKWQPGDRTAFYSDNDIHVFHNGSQWNEPLEEDVVDTVGSRTHPLDQYPEDRGTLSSQSEFFRRIQQVRAVRV